MKFYQKAETHFCTSCLKPYQEGASFSPHYNGACDHYNAVWADEEAARANTAAEASMLRYKAQRFRDAIASRRNA